MAFRMTRPTSRKDSSNEQFRCRVPKDLVEKLQGERFRAALPVSHDPNDGTFSVDALVKEHIKFSLKTSDPHLIRVRSAAATVAVQAYFATARSGPADLSHFELTQLTGEVYRQLVAEHKNNPPQAYDEGWSELEVWQDIADDCEAHATYSPHQAAQVMKRLLDINAFLSARNVRLSAKSFRDFMQALPEALRKAAARVGTMAAGNYGVDPVALQYPVWEKPAAQMPRATTQTSDGSCTTFKQLFEVWRKANNPKPSTISTWEGRVKQFSDFTGKTDPRQCTEADAQRWRDELLERGRKNINNGHLMTMRRLYGYALENSATSGITDNPFAKVKANQKKVAGEQRLPFSQSDAAVILKAARKARLPHLRWIPWLQAQSGARVLEIAQLWGKMVREVDGIPCIHITPAPDGGSLKNAQSERVVPLHPALLAEGFLEFVKERGNGPLFYKETSHKAARARADGASRHKSKGPANRVGEWVNGLGIDMKRKAPTHSWRHWFKTEMLRLKVDQSVRNAIQGHDSRDVSEVYTHVDVRMMLEAISKLDLVAMAKEGDPPTSGQQ
ncbi:site-specific integrase [Rhizobium bangladeshense]|uniref:site-specific integrase n=1 Tax=Rhizobium bangladeshense TaxID=1138189 RepID=UPI001A99FDB4|nr:site-specific integrase [Rhizobium bangladeshense]QSY94838.1 site-specific integrase [Rhizobium bangladeshense]